MFTTHITIKKSVNGPNPHRLHLLNINGSMGLFVDLDCSSYSRITLRMDCVQIHTKQLIDWMPQDGIRPDRTPEQAKVPLLPTIRKYFEFWWPITITAIILFGATEWTLRL